MLQSQGHNITLDIKNPLLADHIRKQLQLLSYALMVPFLLT
jgi:hypothetical protein